MAKNAAEFDKILLNAIDEALNSLGESVKHSIYFHIESKFYVPRNRIPENLEEFQGALEKNLRYRCAVYRDFNHEKPAFKS